MADSSSLSKLTQKQAAQELLDQSAVAWEMGDYGRVVSLSRRVAGLAPNSALSAQAALEGERLRPDPWTLRAGVVALVVYGMAWVWVLTL